MHICVVSMNTSKCIHIIEITNSKNSFYVIKCINNLHHKKKKNSRWLLTIHNENGMYVILFLYTFGPVDE